MRRQHVAESGVIERIELVNFMCHKRLTVPLGPQTNFIIGHNGSGKSAVLTGITIALGGKAAATSRANSLKSFVKEGCSAAEVVLWIKNRGMEAFKPDLYGPRIIIKRRINADGGGGWRMETSAGKIVSTKREELNAFCDHANIQVDNPMNVLTQDAARQFLSATNSGDMYDFFLRGTQLQQLREEYDKIAVNRDNMGRTIQIKKEGLPELEAAAREALRRHQVVQKQQGLQGKLQHLKHQAVWCQVKESERVLTDVITQTEQKRVKLEKTVKEIERLQGLIDHYTDKVTELETQSRGDHDRLGPLQDERAKLKDQIRDLKAELGRVRAEESRQADQYSRLDKTAQDLAGRIEEEASKLAADNREKHERLEARSRELEDQRRQLAEEVNTLATARSDGTSHQRQLETTLEGARHDRNSLRDRLQEREALCQRLVAASRNSIEAFGKGVPELVRAIKNEGRWHKMPVGPIGAHIKLKDTKWAELLESVIGNTLNAFCVTNYHDRRLLEDLKRRLDCQQVPILTAPDEAFDFSGGEPPPHVLTILRVLDVDDDYILRQLVNSVHIESSALVERRAEGDRLMRSGTPNIRICFSGDMFQIRGGAIGSSTQTLNRYRGPPRLSSDVSARLEEARAAFEETQSQLKECGERMRSIDQQLSDTKTAVRQARDKMEVAKRKSDRVRRELDQLQDDMRADEPANVAALEAALHETREELDRCRQSFADVQGEKEKLETKLRPLADRSEEIRSVLSNADEESGALRHELSKVVQSRADAQNQYKQRDASRDKLNAEMEQLQGEAEDKQLTYESNEKLALEYCDGVRVEATRSHEYYEREIEAVEKLMQQARQQAGASIEEVQAQYRSRQKAYDDAKQEIEDMEGSVIQIKRSLDYRLKMWHEFRRHIALRARGSFTYHLDTRGYEGKLFFNHDAAKLSLRVITDTAQNPAAAEEGSSGVRRGKDPRSLSGGEKSFATICLLLSLWEAIGCPIRCLDEFDVFMDAVNRKISMKMIIDTAKTSHNVQYVLITPQNMASTKFGPEVNVQRLSDPERGQGVLTFGS